MPQKHDCLLFFQNLFSVGIGREKNVAAAEGTESKFRILLSLSFQIYSPAASVLLGVQLNLNTEGPILPLKFMLRIFFFCDLNSVQLA